MNKTAAPSIAELLKEVQTILDAKCKRRRFRLRIPRRGYSVEEDWITIVVAPTRAGIDAYDYVNVLSVVEKELRARGHEHVILVPAMGD